MQLFLLILSVFSGVFDFLTRKVTFDCKEMGVLLARFFKRSPEFFNGVARVFPKVFFLSCLLIGLRILSLSFVFL